jgi:hypothetical protein
MVDIKNCETGKRWNFSAFAVRVAEASQQKTH